MDQEITVRMLTASDIPMISDAAGDLSISISDAELTTLLQQQETGARQVYVATIDHEFAGYGSLIWESRHPYFKEQEIAEVQFMRVLPKFRRSGVATTILCRAEQVAASKGLPVGVGMALSANYGAARNMFTRRGYSIAEQGLTHANQPLDSGSTVIVDDELLIWFVKSPSPKRSPFKKSLGQTEPEELFEGLALRRKGIGADDSISPHLDVLNHAVARPGLRLPWFYHENKDEIIIAVKGKGRVHFKESEPLDFEAGDIICVPAKTPHSLENIGNEDIEAYFIKVYD